MDPQQQQEQAQERAAFEQAFASVTGTEPPPAPAAASSDASAEAGAAPAPAPAEAPAPAPAAAAPQASVAPQDGSDAPPAPEGQQAQPAQAAVDDDPVVFEGYKQSELKRLLGSAAKVDSLEQQLRKANGKIGELNSRLQAPAPAPTPTPAPAPELPPELKQLEQDYPDVVQLVRHMVAGQQPRQEAPPAEVQQPVATGGAHAAQAELDPMVVEMAVLDRTNAGWREKIDSQEFNLWLTSQGEQVQREFAEVATADGMGSLLGKYDAWTSARATAADKAAKGQARLKAAVTPSGNAPRPQTAPTEMDAMEAAFKAVLGQ
ncbi:hypothetical protein [Delftia tsuruhatensis]|uniref:hypothetical protein n=1 Tax=Delftia tsuruhatensis TaxID=180282 RepID=UPI0020911CED|nr:hypothetical protein [Delftia tsuruhatensis]MCO5338613.1 hypothetical protein [Delftia tsuruhatensis]MCR4546603.1 hypothetical protein [Delftia tsuruhatensis]